VIGSCNSLGLGIPNIFKMSDTAFLSFSLTLKSSLNDMYI